MKPLVLISSAMFGVWLFIVFYTASDTSLSEESPSSATDKTLWKMTFRKPYTKPYSIPKDSFHVDNDFYPKRNARTESLEAFYLKKKKIIRLETKASKDFENAQSSQNGGRDAVGSGLQRSVQNVEGTKSTKPTHTVMRKVLKPSTSVYTSMLGVGLVGEKVTTLKSNKLITNVISYEMKARPEITKNVKLGNNTILKQQQNQNVTESGENKEINGLARPAIKETGRLHMKKIVIENSKIVGNASLDNKNKSAVNAPENNDLLKANDEKKEHAAAKKTSGPLRSRQNDKILDIENNYDNKNKNQYQRGFGPDNEHMVNSANKKEEKERTAYHENNGEPEQSFISENDYDRNVTPKEEGEKGHNDPFNKTTFRQMSHLGSEKVHLSRPNRKKSSGYYVNIGKTLKTNNTDHAINQTNDKDRFVKNTAKNERQETKVHKHSLSANSNENNTNKLLKRYEHKPGERHRNYEKNAKKLPDSNEEIPKGAPEKFESTENKNLETHTSKRRRNEGQHLTRKQIYIKFRRPRKYRQKAWIAYKRHWKQFKGNMRAYTKKAHDK